VDLATTAMGTWRLTTFTDSNSFTTARISSTDPATQMPTTSEIRLGTHQAQGTGLTELTRNRTQQLPINRQTALPTPRTPQVKGALKDNQAQDLSWDLVEPIFSPFPDK
jgi:hypothetical protein